MTQTVHNRQEIFAKAASWVLEKAACEFPLPYPLERQELATHLGIKSEKESVLYGGATVEYQGTDNISDFSAYVTELLKTLQSEGLLQHTPSAKVDSCRITFLGLQRQRSGAILPS